MAKKKKSNATRILVIILVLFIVGAATAFGLQRAGVFGNQDKGEEVEVADVEFRNITQTVTASGRIQPEVEVKISPDVPGEIITLPIREGDQVEKGDLLVRIRPDNYLAQVERGQASVLQSKAVLAQRKADLLNAEIELKREEDLFNKQAISESQYQQSQTRYQVAQASYEAAEYAVQSSEAQLRDFQEQLDRTAIYAPMAGTISMLSVELGERVVGTSQMAGTEMMRLAKLDQMEIEVDVNENDVVNVSILDSAAIEIDAYPGRIFKGIVTEIANSARVSGAGTQEQVTNFPVKIRVEDPHNILAGAPGGGSAGQLTNAEIPLEEDTTPNFRPGMSGTVDVFTQTVFEAVVVPIQAVTVRDMNQRPKSNGEGEEGEEGDVEEVEDTEEGEDPEQEETYTEDLRTVVFLFEEGKAKMVEVETGISDDSYIAVRKGLEGNEKIVIGPYRAVSRTLQDGATVREEERRPGRPPFAQTE